MEEDITNPMHNLKSKEGEGNLSRPSFAFTAGLSKVKLAKGKNLIRPKVTNVTRNKNHLEQVRMAQVD